LQNKRNVYYREKRGDPVLHIELRKWADVAVVAPLDANTLAKVRIVTVPVQYSSVQPITVRYFTVLYWYVSVAPLDANTRAKVGYIAGVYIP
jgi:flavoprotein